ncbi:MAG TPA: sugar ABC transporter substrate-binding protein [Paenibacillaceae bacterium]
MNRRRTFTVLFAVLLALATVLSACGGGSKSSDGGGSSSPAASQPAGSGSTAGSGSGGGGGSSEAPKPVTLKVLWWGGQTRHDNTLKIIELYQQQNPHVTIEPEFTGFDGYWEKLSAMVAGNNTPDVLQMNFGEYLTQYAKNDVLADLNPFVQSGIIDTSKLDAGILESGVVDGKLLGIPLGMNALTVIYDPELIAKAGAKEPALGWTWDDFKEIARTVHKNLGIYGSPTLEANNILEYYARQNGQKFFNDEGTGVGFDDQIFIDYFNMQVELIKEGVMPTLDVMQQHSALEDQLIVHGKAPFDVRWSNQVVALSKAANRPLKLTVLPGPNTEKGLFLKPSMFFSVAKNSKNAEEAAKFINFFVNTLEVEEIQKGERGVPINSDIREAVSQQLDEVQKNMFEYIDLAAANSSPIDTNYPPGSAEVLSLLGNDIEDRILFSEMTPEEGAKKFREQTAEILARKR